MQLALRPYVTTGICLVGASVLVVAPLSIPPQSLAPLESSVVSMPVVPASLVSDLLNAFEVTSTAGGNTSQVFINSLSGLPLGLAGALNAIIADPSVSPDVLNYLVNSFLSPTASPLIPGGSVFLQLGAAIAPVIGLLPPELRTLAFQLLARVGAAIGEGLTYLPGSTLIGAGALFVGTTTLPPGLLNLLLSIGTLGTGVGQAVGGGLNLGPMAGTTVGLGGWVGAQPALLINTVKAAIASPGDIPGLISYLAYNLLAPPSSLFLPPVAGGSFSLFINAFAPVSLAISQVLGTGPLGDVYAKITAVLNEVIVKGLGVLPDPINPASIVPTPFLKTAGSPVVEENSLVQAPEGNTAPEVKKPGLLSGLGLDGKGSTGGISLLPDPGKLINLSSPRGLFNQVNQFGGLGQKDTTGGSDSSANLGSLFKPLGSLPKHALGSGGGISVNDIAKKLGLGGLGGHKPDSGKTNVA